LPIPQASAYGNVHGYRRPKWLPAIRPTSQRTFALASLTVFQPLDDLIVHTMHRGGKAPVTGIGTAVAGDEIGIGISQALDATVNKTTARCSASPVVPHTLQILDSNLPPDSVHLG
jgi:hypothetical protein